jgi:hypothetical protein
MEHQFRCQIGKPVSSLGLVALLDADSSIPDRPENVESPILEKLIEHGIVCSESLPVVGTGCDGDPPDTPESAIDPQTATFRHSVSHHTLLALSPAALNPTDQVRLIPPFGRVT